MERSFMPLTTDSTSDADAPADSAQNPDSGAGNSGPDKSSSGYDVISSAASPQAARMPRRWDLYILFNVAIPVLLLLAGFLVIRILGQATAGSAPPTDGSAAALLETLPATRVEQIRSLAETGRQLELVIDGTVVPFREALVASEVAGKVISKSESCEAGSIVKQGDVLMRIDATDYQLDVERLTRQREQEYRAIGEVDQEMVNAKRLIEVAEQDVELQSNQLKRQLKLKSATSQSEVDNAKSKLLQSTQQLVTLENQLSLLRTRRSRLESSEQLAATQLRSAEVNLERCVIRAPIDGVIVSEQADVNTFVNRGTALVTIEDTTHVEIAANMRMDQLHWVLDQDSDRERTGYTLPNTPAVIEYEIAGRESAVNRWNGTLVSYDGIGIDPSTRTVPVRLVVDDPRHFVDAQGKPKVADRGRTLVRGMFVSIRLQLQPQTPLIVIPGRALRPGNKVWKFEPDPSIVTQMVAARQLEDERNASESAGDDSPPAPTEDTEQLLTPPAFDAAAWSAGRVTYSSSVYPVESLRLTSPQALDPLLAPSLQSVGRDWICEADQLDLKAGDYVVVSPLESIPPEGISARAELP
ncbi:HlyD family efflux transporter periplasmic adaptor subunit [Stieleria sp. TO1_6]|uniref:efflux RND transporter periplasmic adaptor subunit n=1 Tax=Stieleria tagensis TaxID=2956795 RepID=UPI00209AEA3B|nr:HlyD family efflux transporter periplasmic adaptor subunit [Stieleria tagensis]MCO8121046.1 HlyD family efflux transporter periplasmic adaptor subunit [Stieleria tagensis]